MAPVPKCKEGEILREGYVRSSGTKVKPTCVKDPLRGKRKPGELGPNRKPRGLVGEDGKKKRIKVKKGRLSEHGYSVDDEESERRAALRRVIRAEKKAGDYNWLSLYRRLILLSTWNKRVNKARAKRARSDAEYVKQLSSSSSS